MNVAELYKLAEWFNEHFQTLASLYNSLINPVSHNASQPNKQPIEDQTNSLIEYLKSMTFDELSIQQLNMLSKLDVEKYIGSEGARFVSDTIRTSNYDPATALQRLQQAMQIMSNASNGFQAFINASNSLGVIESKSDDEDEFITIRVGFRNEASIDNISDWKDSAKEWYDIARGLALACGESPEDTKVVGASTGSIILILAGTLSFTTLLALISKNVAGVAKDVIGVRSEIEGLRQKGLLTKLMENELKKIEKSKKDYALKNIMELIKDNVTNKDGEVDNALENSIQKLLSFNEKGGNVDFVAPDSDIDPENEGEANGDAAMKAALSAAQEAIRAYQGERESLKLLVDGTRQPQG